MFTQFARADKNHTFQIPGSNIIKVSKNEGNVCVFAGVWWVGGGEQWSVKSRAGLVIGSTSHANHENCVIDPTLLSTFMLSTLANFAIRVRELAAQKPQIISQNKQGPSLENCTRSTGSRTIKSYQWPKLHSIFVLYSSVTYLGK